MAKTKQTKATIDAPVKPEVPAVSAGASAFRIVKVKPGIVYWGTDKIPWRNWDLRTISEADKQLLYEAGFEYLKRVEH